MRPAFYALRAGGWRDYVTLLHAPYTAWHLSYVVVGGCLAAEVPWGRLGLTVSHSSSRWASARTHSTSSRAGRSGRHPGRVLDRTRDRIGRRAPVRSGSPSHSTSASGCFRSSRRRLPRARLQPRALRRPLPLRPLVRPRVGRVPGRHRVRRLRRDARGPAVLAAAWATRPLPRPAPALDPGSAPARRDVVAVAGELELHGGTREAVTRELLVAAPEAALRLLALVDRPHGGRARAVRL